MPFLSLNRGNRAARRLPDVCNVKDCDEWHDGYVILYDNDSAEEIIINLELVLWS